MCCIMFSFLHTMAVRYGKWRFVLSLLIAGVLLLMLDSSHTRLTLCGRCPAPIEKKKEGPSQHGGQIFPSFSVHIMERGVNVKVGEMTEVHVMSAIQRENYPVPGAFNVVLVTWSDNRVDQHSFMCCLSPSPTFADPVVEVRATKLFFDTRLKVDMRYALFACSVANGTALRPWKLRYVAFSERSCWGQLTREGHRLDAPLPSPGGGGTLAVCVKVAYGYLVPQRLLAWFEMVLLLGVSMVQVFYHVVNEEAMAVFRHYQRSGLVSLSPVTPAARAGHPPRGFMRPRREMQAWMDGAVICNDCLHRLSRYEFVAILDFDELLLPSPPFNDLPRVLQTAAKAFPDAATFFIETFVVLLDWPAADNQSAIWFLKHLDRTLNDKLDNFGHGKSSPKVIFRPTRVEAVATHDVTVKGNYSRVKLPKNSYKFLHYRRCKQELWKGCDWMERIRDTEPLRFKSRWIHAISKLPLQSLGCDRQFVHDVQAEAKRLHDTMSSI